MNKFFIDEEAYKYLSEWAEKNKSAVIWCPYYFKKVEVVLKDADFKFYIEAKADYFAFRLKDENGSIYSGKIYHIDSDDHDFQIQYKLHCNLDKPDIYADILRVYCSSFFHANCFMWKGNLVEDKVFSASGKNIGEDKIITFRKYKDSVYAIPTSHHKSPEGVFSVRGHFRRYKSGKIIWIDEFLKGTK